MIVVGQAPNRSGHAGFSRSSVSGRRLELALGRGFQERCKVVNLVDEWPGKNGAEGGRSPRGDAFPMDKALCKASLVVAEALSCRRNVLLLGEKVATAFGLQGLPWCSWRYWLQGARPLLVKELQEKERGLPELRWFRVGLLPHPSPAHRWWDRKENVRMARKFLKEGGWPS